MDKRIEKGDETYSRIVASAIELVSQNGISGITASKLSQLSGISKSTIFHHFKTTKAIPEAVLRLLFQELLMHMEIRGDENLAIFLNRVGREYINCLEKEIKIYKSFFSFYHESMFDQVYQKGMNEFLLQSRGDLATKIEELTDKSITKQDANSFAGLIIASLDGIGMHILIGGEKEEYLKIWELQSKILCDYISVYR